MNRTLMIIVTIGIIAIFGLYVYEKDRFFSSPTEETFCTTDVMECADGSFVSRELPDCQFKACSRTPNEDVPTNPRPTEPTKTTAPSDGKCYVGGCSSQICSDNPNVVTTCEYREEYGCYQGAVCERQASGECGWTETKELRECIISPDSFNNK